MRFKRILATVFAFLLVFSFSVKCAAKDEKESEKSHVVLIDPGHGGIDGGAKSKQGTIEKDINLAIALKLKESLEKDNYKVL